MAVAGERVFFTRKPLIFFVFAFFIYSFGYSSYLLQDHIGPVWRGFFCNDQSIRFPYRPSTIGIVPVVVLGYVFVVGSIILVEVGFWHRQGTQLSDDFRFFGAPVHPTIVRILEFFTVSQLGYMTTVWLYKVLKITNGNLRPHFLDVCKPNVNLTHCTPNLFIEDYECLGDPIRTTHARLSWPSGHSATAFFFAIFVILYLHLRYGRHRREWVPFLFLLYVIIFAAAAWVACSRIFDYKHHAVDVACGSLLGAGVAFFASRAFSGLFDEPLRAPEFDIKV